MTLHQVLRRSGDSLAALDLCSDPGSAAGATGGSQVGNWDRGLGMNVICLFFLGGSCFWKKGNQVEANRFGGSYITGSTFVCCIYFY